MQHLVHFTTAERREGHHIAASLEDAVQFAERLRNAEGATDVVLYRLTEVPIAFKTYYRVEVNAPEPMPAASPGVTALPPVEEVAAPAAAEVLPESAAANGRRLFSRT